MIQDDIAMEKIKTKEIKVPKKKVKKIILTSPKILFKIITT